MPPLLSGNTMTLTWRGRTFQLCYEEEIPLEAFKGGGSSTLRFCVLYQIFTNISGHLRNLTNKNRGGESNIDSSSLSL